VDITEALAPTSDQLDAIELVNPRTFTIDTGSRLGSRDGKTVAEIRLVDFPRVWRPSKGMLDVLAACWGTDAKTWVGHRVTFYNDPDVMFGRDKVGGVRISHLSHIDSGRNLTIRAPGQGKTQRWHVDPLPDAAPSPSSQPKPAPTRDQIAECADIDQLNAWAAEYQGPRRDAALARVAELGAPPALDDAADAAWLGGETA
jgi:hypothetical protein